MKVFFPKKIFLNQFFVLCGAMLLVGVLCLGIGYWFLLPEIGAGSVLSLLEFQRLLRIWILQGLPLYLGLSIVLSALISYRSVLPIAHVIAKVRLLLLRKGRSSWVNDKSIYEEETGEFYELEVALERLRKKLKKKYDQLAQVHEETEAIMSAVGASIVSVDLQQKLIFYNSHFAAIFAEKNPIEGGKTVLPTSLSEVLRVPEILALFNSALSDGEQGTISVEIENLGRKRFFSVVVSSLKRAHNGEVYGALGVFHDITELKNAERIRIDFLSNASHELRSPLTAVKGYTDTLMEDIEAKRWEQVPQFVEIVHRNVNRLVDLVNDLLLISKLESSGELMREEILTMPLTQAVLEQLRQESSAKNQKIIIHDNVVEFFADPVKVEQVLRNLLSNAIRYVPENGEITITWIPIGTKGEVQLRVRDNGPGIADTHLGRIFERFYRIDKGRSREVGGTGLGLAIVKHIMQAHGGNAKVKSYPGAGAEFICTFPRQEESLSWT